MVSTTPTSAEQLLALLRPGRRRKDGTLIEAKNTYDDQEIVAMMYRFAGNLEARAIANPELLVHLVKLGERIAEIPNVAIATSMERYKINPAWAASLRECARAMGISSASAHGRAVRGREIIAERLDKAGAASLTARRRAAEAGKNAEQIESAAQRGARSAELARDRERIETADRLAQEAMPEYRERTAEYRGRHLRVA